MADFSAAGRLLLGTVDWEREDWLAGYYPPDLPPVWRLAYYANDSGCVLLRADIWRGTDRESLQESLDEAGEGLVYFLEHPTGDRHDFHENLALFESFSAVLLVSRPDPGQERLAQWVAKGPDLWVDTDSDASLVRWPLETIDMRALRARADLLPASVQALVLDGPAATPTAVPELRTLLELMGKA